MDVTAKISELKDDIASRRGEAVSLVDKTETQSDTTNTMSYSLDDYDDELQREIVRIYSLADNIIAAVVSENIINHEAQFNIAKPFAEEAIDCADVLAAFYAEAIQGNVVITQELQHGLEEAFQYFFAALHAAVDAMEGMIEKSRYPASTKAVLRIKPKSPFAEKFLKRPLRGTEGARLDTVRLHINNETGRPLVDAVDEIACHVAQLVVEFARPELGYIRSYEAGNPARGITSKLARRAAQRLDNQ